jgi:hypothetical protein
MRGLLLRARIRNGNESRPNRADWNYRPDRLDKSACKPTRNPPCKSTRKPTGLDPTDHEYAGFRAERTDLRSLGAGGNHPGGCR